MTEIKHKDSKWSWRKFLMIGGICLFIGMLSSFILGGRLSTDIGSLLRNAGYSLMIGYGLFANGYVISLVDKRWLSWLKKPLRSLLIAFSTTIVYSTLVILFTNWFWYCLIMDISWGDFLTFGKKVLLLEYIVLYLITLFLFARGFFNEWRVSMVAKERLKQEAVTLQYKVLSNQVNPHFLFNSLNVLSSLIKINPDRAEVFVSKLSNFYRDLLSFRGKEIVSLQEELDFVQQYLDLQQERFGDKINIEIDLGNRNDYQIIPMTLQMLVENAIKHNQVNSENKLHIKISLEKDYLIVENNFKPYLSPVDGERLGLKNLSERYTFLTNSPFVVEKDEKYFRVKVPLLMMEEI